MAKRLKPSVIAASKKSGSRAERREQEKKRLHEEIAVSQGSGGVIVIPPPAAQCRVSRKPKVRVAPYCRVSTQEEQQVGSFEMQIHHFRQQVENNPDWVLVDIFHDEGISGTSTNKRLGFQRMMAAAENGEIDLIITKSISRFGRNSVDVLENLRKLSALNPPVTVKFESEGLTSIGDSSNNMMIAILSAVAEMESQQKSEAIKAGIRWRMAEGIYRFSVHNTLGYYRDHFGRIVIEPSEAKIVEYIYESCLEGASPTEIAQVLTEQGVETPMGRECWLPSTVKGILSNEKYCGDALMQKTYIRDFREHISVKNMVLNKYLKENHHAAIIPRSDWNKVQQILSLRREAGAKTTLRRLNTRFVAKRVKNGYLRDAFILDPRWTSADRREFLKMIGTAHTTTHFER